MNLRFFELLFWKLEEQFPPKPKLRWKANQRDLIELAYAIRITNLVETTDGSVLTIEMVTNELSSIFGLPIDDNLTRTVDNIKKRKDLYSGSILWRMFHTLYNVNGR